MEGDGFIDSEVAAMLLGITKNNLRQLVRRGLITPVGRQKRRSMFALQNVVELQKHKEQSNTWVR